MLSYLRKKKGSTLMKGLLIALALTFFGGFGMLGYCSRKEKAQIREANMAAKVNDSVITRQALSRAIGLANRRESRPDTEAEIEKQRHDVLDTLINQELVLREAGRLGFEASDQEVKLHIMQTFAREGGFNPGMFASFLASVGLSEEQYYQEIRNSLLITKISRAVAGGAVVADEDVRRFYLYENERANLQLIKVDPEKMEDIEEPSDQEVRARFDEDPEAYILPEKRTVKYACVYPEDVVKPEDVTDDEAKGMYERYKDLKFAKKPRKVRARKILLSAPFNISPEEKEAIKRKAENIATEAKLGSMSFEELAKKYSEDTETASNGGDMGWVSIGETGFWSDRALMKMKVGEISDPVTTLNGFMIFKVEDVVEGKYKSFRSVRAEAVEMVQKVKGKTKAKEVAQNIIDMVRDATPFADAVKAATAEVKISEPFEKGANVVDDMEGSAAMVNEAYKMWEIEQVSDVINMPDRSCVLQLTEIFEEHAATFEEAIPLIREEMTAEKRKEAARKFAEKIIESVRNGTPFEKAPGNAAYAELIETDYFAREKKTVPTVGYAPDMVNAAFALPAHDPVSEEIFDVGGKLYLVKLLGKKEADPEGYNAVFGQLKARLLAERQGELIDSWIESLKKKAKIVNKLEEENRGM